MDKDTRRESLAKELFMKSIGDYKGYEWDDFDFDGKSLEVPFMKISAIILARERKLEERVKSLEAYNKELKEKAWMYDQLCK
jgi:hypothetical protein